MEPPAHAEDPADPADAADTADSAEACAKQPGKWALVRSLNQALKAYALMPVRPGREREVRPGYSARASVSLPVRRQKDHGVAKSQGARRRGLGWDGGLAGVRLVPDSSGHWPRLPLPGRACAFTQGGWAGAQKGFLCLRGVQSREPSRCPRDLGRRLCTGWPTGSPLSPKVSNWTLPSHRHPGECIGSPFPPVEKGLIRRVS